MPSGDAKETTNLDIYGHDPLPWSRARDQYRSGNGERIFGEHREADERAGREMRLLVHKRNRGSPIVFRQRTGPGWRCEESHPCAEEPARARRVCEIQEPVSEERRAEQENDQRERNPIVRGPKTDPGAYEQTAEKDDRNSGGAQTHRCERDPHGRRRRGTHQESGEGVAR